MNLLAASGILAGRVSLHALFEVRHHQSENRTVLQQRAGIAQCPAELVQRQMLENVAAVNSPAAAIGDRQATDDVAVLDVVGKA